MAEYIEREAVYDIFTAKQQELLKFYRYYQLSGEEKEEFNRYDGYLNEIEAIPTADVVSREVFEQVKWERDTALQTLQEHGIGLGQKADVVEVKHGEWKVCGLMNPQCSLCHKYNIEKSRFCPHCGAKMDKKVGAENDL